MTSRSTASIKLIDCLNNLPPESSGYLIFNYSLPDRRHNLKLYIGVVNGRVVYSDIERFSIKKLFEIIRRYTIQTHYPGISSVMDKVLEDALITKPLDKILQLIQLAVIDESQLRRALRHQILSDIDFCLFRSGIGEFVPDTYLSACLPIKGFLVETVIENSSLRIKSWEAIKSQISLEDVLTLKQEFVSPKLLPLGQRDLIVDLIRNRTKVGNIAARIAKDDLDVCYMLVEMIKEDIISIPRKIVKSAKPLPPPIRPILAIDSSDSMLSRLYAFIDEMGYPCMRCNDIDLAIEVLRRQQPALILIELNMLGFGESSIVHAIKENPGLVDVPVAIMVDEGRKVSRMTARLNNYHEVQKPETSSGLSGAKFKEQISGILASTSNRLDYN
ncbi:hypothetical protein [Chamaesiphon sp.]|uniref:hypothetical protein n=1 Tax=Chamaesiphon sp. TaxID=2814140 RepID=UPI0035948D06